MVSARRNDYSSDPAYTNGKQGIVVNEGSWISPPPYKVAIRSKYYSNTEPRSGKEHQIEPHAKEGFIKDFRTMDKKQVGKLTDYVWDDKRWKSFCHCTCYCSQFEFFQ